MVGHDFQGVLYIPDATDRWDCQDGLPTSWGGLGRQSYSSPMECMGMVLGGEAKIPFLHDHAAGATPKQNKKPGCQGTS